MTSITASDTIQYSNDTYISAYNGYPPTKLKEISLTDSYTGSWRIVFDYSCCSDSGAGSECYNTPVYFQLYKNGFPYGTFLTTYSCSWNTQLQDFTNINIASTDKIQIYGYMSDAYADTTLTIKNFRIEFTSTVSTGNASFASTPSGATIWVDGTSTGITTPNTITNLSVGTHSYKLSLAGYNVSSGNFTTTAGTTTTIPTILLTGTAMAFLTAGD